MEVVPAIDLANGRAVFLERGTPGTESPVVGDPTEWARRWERAGAVRLHLIDLDRALGRGDNSRTVRAILAETRLPVQVGGGLRTTEDVETLLTGSPRTRAIVGTRALREPAWLERLARRWPERLVVALDRDQRGLRVEGWREGVAGPVAPRVEWANGLPLAGVLFTDIPREGRLEGVAPRRSRLVAMCRHPRIAAGGVAGPEDLERLRRSGYDAAVVGKALYEGRLEFVPRWEGPG